MLRVLLSLGWKREAVAMQSCSTFRFEVIFFFSLFSKTCSVFIQVSAEKVLP